jgi:8-oxo-dGTP pyrophosphatase MutT (NUDIX family)
MKHDKVADFKFLSIYKVTDPKNGVGGYYYAERLGRDSIAFICFDRNINKFLLNIEYKPPVSKFITGAFGGSLDKDKSAIEIVLDEVHEEAGFSVDKEKVIDLGKVFVSTQMNQYCGLYLVEVDRNDAIDRKPENQIEAASLLTWLTEREVMLSQDWKAITIVSKAKEKGIL